MKLYLAHNYAAKDYLRYTVQTQLEKMGHTITSNWLTVAEDNPNLLSNYAQMDLNDVDTADAIVLFQEQFGQTPGRGKFMEFGYALAKNKKMFVVSASGAKDCIFYNLPQVQCCANLPQLINLLDLYAKET